MAQEAPRAVVDTNVLFEGLTRRRGAAGAVVDAWVADLFRPCVSDALAFEYADVLGRKLSAARWEALQPVLGALLERAEFVPIYFTWRPMSPDPADEHVVDCAMNAAAVVVTTNVRDFEQARRRLGLEVQTPVEFARALGLSDLPPGRSTP